MTDVQRQRRLIQNPAVQGVLFTVAWLAVTNVTIYFIYLRSVEAVKEEIREGLLRNVSTAATSLDGDEHRGFTSKAQINDPTYKAFIAQMEKMRKASKDVRYLYTNINKDGKIYFVANGSPQNDNNKDGKPDEAPQLMDPYPDAGKALQDALRTNTPTVDREPYTDAWGTFYSAYAPFKDSSGRVVGTLGMDLELRTLQQRLKPIGIAAQRAAFTSGILAILFGAAVWFFRSRNGILETMRTMAESRLKSIQDERSKEQAAAATQLEAVAQRIVTLPQSSSSNTEADTAVEGQHTAYAQALRRYAMARKGHRSEHGENFDPVHLIRSCLTEEVQLQADPVVPNQVFGDPEELHHILHSLCFSPFSNTVLGSLNLATVGVENEQLNTLHLLITLRFQGRSDATVNGANLISDRDHPEHVFDENSLQFATCCEQVRALKGSLTHSYEAENTELVVLSLPYEKFREA